MIIIENILVKFANKFNSQDEDVLQLNTELLMPQENA